ncbi:hypothetical protein HYV30_03375 [Candidatus Kaiserbacteria bacterium]|nr:hypothetical protein [Candidatus Kaiserbacteria bacterium]
MLPFLKGLGNWVENLTKQSGFRINEWPIFILGLTLLFLSFLFMPGAVALALELALFLAPVWLPFLLLSGAWLLWVILKQSEFIASQKHILLELIPPRNLIKTPLAMETVFAGLHQGGGEGTWYVKYIKGQTRPWFSFEIASIGGDVHFFIWTRAAWRRLIEAQIYAQYPGVQVVEAVDYTRTVSADPKDWGVWGCDFKHSKEDPLPIKTYVEYGLDKVQKEPEQVDPLANLIEYLGSFRKDEQLWLQIIIRTHKGEKYKKLTKEGKAWTWKEEAQVLIQKIREQTRDKYVDPVTGTERPGFPNPTKGQSEKIAAIERNISKQAFDVGLRGVYLVHTARGGKFDVAMGVAGLTGAFKQFQSEEWNGFSPTGWLSIFSDYPWEKALGVDKLKDKFRKGVVEAFRRRQFFYEPADAGKNAMVMSTEELATIFHIPSAAVVTPSLERIQSPTGEAPANLPV